MQATLDQMRAKLVIPGVSVTVLFRDSTAWTGVSGWLRRSAEALAQPGKPG
jgi:hypothetical protein